MKKFSVNDWLTIQTRKDVSLLRRTIKNEPIQYGILIDLMLVVLSTCLDNVYGFSCGGKTSPSLLWWCISGIAFIVTLVSITIGCWWKRKKKVDHLMVYSSSELVDLFDNEICYNIMTADSMNDHIIFDETGIVTGLDDDMQEIQKYYFIETCYYLDKAINQLYRFNKSAEKVIFREYDGNGVSIDRFQNICTLIKSTYVRLIQAVRNKPEYKRLINWKAVHKFNTLIVQISVNDGFTELTECKIEMES